MNQRRTISEKRKMKRENQTKVSRRPPTITFFPKNLEISFDRIIFTALIHVAGSFVADI